MQNSNLDVIRRWNQENWKADAVTELVAPDFVAHIGDRDVRGPDGWIKFSLDGTAGVQDIEAGQDEVFTSGNLIGERWWLRYTDADGTQVRWHGITMHRVADGRLQEDWVAAEQDG
jgi:hypothetical protein